MKPIIKSILDTDLYKLSQGYAVAKRYPRALVRYAFFNRGQDPFPDGFADNLLKQIQLMAEVSLTVDEYHFLDKRCGEFLDPQYLDWLRGFRFDPSEVTVVQTEGELQIAIEGYWYRAIYWEVPLMALISELYFKMVGQPILRETGKPGDFALDLDEVFSLASYKGMSLTSNGVKYADYGTRRRYSYEVHREVVRTMTAYEPGFVGTSNVHLAHLFDIKPIGTQAHEWFMYHGAKYGYRDANKVALGRWADIFGGRLGVALTDTFTTEAFFRAFDLFHAKLFDGVRHDSANPFEFGKRVIDHYVKLGIDPTSKTIVFFRQSRYREGDCAQAEVRRSYQDELRHRNAFH